MIFRMPEAAFYKKPKKGKGELEMLENSEEIRSSLKSGQLLQRENCVSFLEKDNMDSGSLELVIRNALEKRRPS